MTFIWWIYHFWARFWPYFNFVDFRAFFGPFSLVNRDRQKMADLLRKMASNQKVQENKPTLKFNFTIEKRWPVSIFGLFGPQHLSHWALMCISRTTLDCSATCSTRGRLLYRSTDALDRFDFFVHVLIAGGLCKDHPSATGGFVTWTESNPLRDQTV